MRESKLSPRLLAVEGRAVPSEDSPPDTPRRRSSMQRHAAIMSSLCYASASVGLSLVNKAIFSDHAFDFPLSVLACQAAGTVLLLLLVAAARLIEPLPLDRRLLRAMLPVTLLFVTMLFTSSRALRHCSVPVVTIFKNSSVVLVTIYEWAVYGQPISCGITLSLACMLTGSAVAGLGDLHFSLVGYTWIALNVLATVAHLAGIRAWLATSATNTAKTLHNQLLALVIFAVGAAGRGELPAFAGALALQSARFQAGFVASIFLGGLINFASFWCLSVTSGTTYSFVGASNKVPSAVLGHFFFSSGLNGIGCVGVCFGLAAGFGFAWSQHEMERTRLLRARASGDAGADDHGHDREV